MKHPSYLRNLEESDHQCHSALPAVWFWMALWHTMGGRIVRPRIVLPDTKSRRKHFFFGLYFKAFHIILISLTSRSTRQWGIGTDGCVLTLIKLLA